LRGAPKLRSRYYFIEAAKNIKDDEKLLDKLSNEAKRTKQNAINALKDRVRKVL
jgi:hypothetical protein